MWKRLAAHPLVPLSVGGFVSFLSPGQVLPKSYALLIVWLWLTVDLSSWLKGHLRETSKYRYALLCAAIATTASVMLYADQWFLNQWLMELQKDTYLRLSSSVDLPNDGNPFLSMFTITNGSPNKIAQHTISCGMNLIVTDGWEVSNISGGAKTSDAPLIGGGDAQTDPCLSIFNISNPKCFDVTVVFSYSLDVQPELSTNKFFRFVGRPLTGRFMWTRQPVEQRQTYCESFKR